MLIRWGVCVNFVVGGGFFNFFYEPTAYKEVRTDKYFVSNFYLVGVGLFTNSQ